MSTNGTGWMPLVVSLGVGLAVAAAVIGTTRKEGGVTDGVREAVDVEALGRCGQCRSRETPGIIDQYSHSVHAAEGVTCIDCHQEREGMETMDHHDFTIIANPTAGACAECHATEYEQFQRSRHAVPAMTAVLGAEVYTQEQLDHARQYHPNAIERGENGLQIFEGPFAAESGCIQCHSIGEPRDDGSIGDCTACHGNHASSRELASAATTCGSCHMGPDHSQLEIWQESRHGVMAEVNPDQAPTCATCHMSGTGENTAMTHDVTERLSVYLFPPVSELRPNSQRGRDAMQQVCAECHGPSQIETLYENAMGTVENTNEMVAAARAVYQGMVDDGCLTGGGWDEPADFIWFNLWHHQGRTSKHGAFMGGADYVQWHGNYEIIHAAAELNEIDHELRASGRCANVAPDALDPLIRPESPTAAPTVPDEEALPEGGDE